MSTIVSKGHSFLRCDTVGCTRETAAVSGPNDGQDNVDEFARAAGWRVGYQDKHVTCPTCLTRERARMLGGETPSQMMAKQIVRAVADYIRGHGVNDIRELPHKTELLEDIELIIDNNRKP